MKFFFLLLGFAGYSSSPHQTKPGNAEASSRKGTLIEGHVATLTSCVLFIKGLVTCYVMSVSEIAKLLYLCSINVGQSNQNSPNILNSHI